MMGYSLYKARQYAKRELKTIDGKRYQREGLYQTKSEALEHARIWRKRGRNARIIKGSAGNSPIYRVYVQT